MGGHDAVLDSGEGTRSFGDPVTVSRMGIEQARAKQYDVVIVDTAGRLAVDANLMQQASDIRAAIAPDEVLFVLDAMIGQAAVETAQAFHEGVAFTGVVLSKLDGDARGGAALSVAELTGEPIMFASTGEKVTDIEVFHPDRMASRILDMGDVLTLIEQAEKAFDKRQADEMARKFLAEEDFTFEDFLQQMNAIKKMGSLKSMLKMMPGMQGMRDQLDAFDDREFDRVEAMVRSMTPFERTHPKQINGSRRARIAKGSGVTVTEVNQLLERFGQAQKMMKSMARGGGGGLPGMPGHPRHRQARQAAAAAAQEEQERQPRQARRRGARRGGEGRLRPCRIGRERLRRCRVPAVPARATTPTRWPASTPRTCPRASRSSSAVISRLRTGPQVTSGIPPSLGMHGRPVAVRSVATHVRCSGSARRDHASASRCRRPPTRALRAPASRATMVVGQGDHSYPEKVALDDYNHPTGRGSRDSGQRRPVASAADPEEEAALGHPGRRGRRRLRRRCRHRLRPDVAVVHLVEAELTVGTSTFLGSRADRPRVLPCPAGRAPRRVAGRDPQGAPLVFFHGTPGGRLQAALGDGPASTRRGAARRASPGPATAVRPTRRTTLTSVAHGRPGIGRRPARDRRASPCSGSSGRRPYARRGGGRPRPGARGRGRRRHRRRCSTLDPAVADDPRSARRSPGTSMAAVAAPGRRDDGAPGPDERVGRRLGRALRVGGFVSPEMLEPWTAERRDPRAVLPRARRGTRSPSPSAGTRPRRRPRARSTLWYGDRDRRSGSSTAVAARPPADVAARRPGGRRTPRDAHGALGRRPHGSDARRRLGSVP